MVGGGDHRAGRHECKVCGRSFPCGRSLGGHMRSHLSFTSAAASPETDERPQAHCRSSAVSSAGYGLRENPKKTWRMSEPAASCAAAAVADDKLGKLCKECGKGFSSWKSLFGHMSCHSRSKFEDDDEEEEEEEEEEEDEEEEEYEEIEDQEQVEEEDGLNEGQSDNEIVVPRKKQRSRRVASITCSSSSTATEIDKEQEDVALTLVMLSRDTVGFWSSVNSVAESSNGSSVISENKESELQKSKSYFCHADRFVISDVASKKCSYSRNNPNCGGEDQYRKRMSNATVRTAEINGFQLPDEASKNCYFKSKNPNCSEDQCKKRMMISPGIRIAGSGGGGGGDEASKKCSSKSKSPNLGEDQSRKNMIPEIFDARLSASAVNGGGSSKLPKKRGRYECTLCHKSFLSYQAFGGHRASHMRTTKDSAGMKVAAAAAAKIGDHHSIRNRKEKQVEEAVQDSAGNNTASLGSSRKAKEHQCPVCFKVFSSGQALGGHKRSHLISSSSINGGRALGTIVIQQRTAPVVELIDLNLPAPTNESCNAENGTLFSPCWMSIKPEQEPLVGLISN